MALSLDRSKLAAATPLLLCLAGLLDPVAWPLCPHMAANTYRFLASTFVGATVLVQPLGCSRPPRTSFLFRVTPAVAARVSAWVFVCVGPTSLSKLKSSPCLLPNIAALRCCKCFVAGGALLAKVSGSVTTTCLLTDKSYWYERSPCRFPSNASVKQGFLSAFSGNRSSARLGRGVG